MQKTHFGPRPHLDPKSHGLSHIMVTSFSGGRSLNTRREPPTMGKQLVNFITCGCESSALFLYLTKLGANPRRIGDRLV